MLDKTASKRLGILIKTATAKGKPATDQQIDQWEKASQNKQWIPGTPWNIPQSHRKHIIVHLKDVAGIS